MFVGANLRFFWDKGWGAEIKAKTEGENVVLFCPQIIVSFWWLRAFGMISEWVRNEFGMISGCQTLKNGCVFCIENFDIVKWKIKWERCLKYLWAMPKFFVFWWKVIFFKMKGHSKNDLFWLRKALRMRIFTCFLGKGHSVIWSFLKKNVG